MHCKQSELGSEGTVGRVQAEGLEESWLSLCGDEGWSSASDACHRGGEQWSEGLQQYGDKRGVCGRHIQGEQYVRQGGMEAYGQQDCRAENVAAEAACGAEEEIPGCQDNGAPQYMGRGHARQMAEELPLLQCCGGV